MIFSSKIYKSSLFKISSYFSIFRWKTQKFVQVTEDTVLKFLKGLVQQEHEKNYF